IVALDAHTGAKRWEADLGTDGPGGGGFFGAIAIADGLLFAPVDDPTGQGGGVVALDATTGAQRWTFDAGVNLRAAAVAAGTVVAVGGFVDMTYYPPAGRGAIVAVDAATGALRWRTDTENLIFTDPAIAGGTVFTGDDGGEAHAIDLATGKERWARWLTATT